MREREGGKGERGFVQRTATDFSTRRITKLRKKLEEGKRTKKKGLNCKSIADSVLIFV